MVSKLFKALLLFSPIAITCDFPMDMLDVIIFRFGVMALFMASLIDSPKREIPNNFIHVFLGLMGVCIINLFAHTFRPEIVFTTLNIWFFIVGACIVFRYFDGSDIKKYILIAAGINLIFFLAQRFGIDPVYAHKTYIGESGAFLGNKARLTTYFAVITAFLPAYLLFIPALIGVLTKQIALFVPIFIILAIRVKGARRYFVLTSFILGCLIFKQHIIDSFLFRFNTAWLPAMRHFFQGPLHGHGLGVQIPESDFIGNSYLMFITGTGIIGIAFMGWMFRILKGYWTVPALCLLGLMFIEYPIEIPRLWFTIMAILLGARLNREVDNVSS